MLNANTQHIEDAATDIIETTQVNITEEYDKFIQKLEQFMDSRNAHCIEEQKENYTQLPNKTYQGLRSCVYVKVNETLAIRDAIIEDIKSIPGRAASIKEAWQACSNPLCYVSVINDARKQIADIPIDIAKQICKVPDFLETLKSDLIDCGKEQIKKIANDGLDIIASITKCFLS